MGRGRPLWESKVQVSALEQVLMTLNLSGRRSRIRWRIRSGRRKISVRRAGEKRRKRMGKKEVTRVTFQRILLFRSPESRFRGYFCFVLQSHVSEDTSVSFSRVTFQRILLFLSPESRFRRYFCFVLQSHLSTLMMEVIRSSKTSVITLV